MPIGTRYRVEGAKIVSNSDAKEHDPAVLKRLATALMATVLNRQPVPEESDAFLKSGDGLALLLASPAFQRC